MPIADLVVPQTIFSTYLVFILAESRDRPEKQQEGSFLKTSRQMRVISGGFLHHVTQLTNGGFLCLHRCASIP